MDYEKIARKFVMRLGGRLQVAIHPSTEAELIGEIVSMMKSAVQNKKKIVDASEIWDQSADRDWGYGGA